MVLVIYWQIRESRLNKTARHSIEKCDTEFQQSLKKIIKSPPFHLTVACIVIELAAEYVHGEVLWIYVDVSFINFHFFFLLIELYKRKEQK